jgi:hypothetical protein
VQRELAAEELKQTLKEQAQSIGLHEIIEETQEAATAAEQLLKPDQPASSAVSTASPDAKSSSTPGSQHGGS